jgi:ribose/xylose/arabinose/galactoside ABC-type transport system permease subunit
MSHALSASAFVRHFTSSAQQLTIGSAVVLLGIALTVLTPHFLTLSNLTNVARQVALTATLGAGQTVVIISGGIDISVGSTIALASCLIAYTLRASNGSLVLGTGVGLLTGVAVGIANGLIITRINLPPFLVTLGMLAIVRGITFIITDAQPISVLKFSTFGVWGQSYLGPIPLPVLIMLAVFLLVHLLLRHTLFGYVYAIGGNERAARLVGIRVDKYKIAVYVFNGLLVGVTAVMLTSRLLSGIPTLGAGFELLAITMAILGGTSFLGGRGFIWGTLLGAVLLGLLANGMNLLNISPFYQDLMTGVVVLLAIIVDRFVRMRGT